MTEQTHAINKAIVVGRLSTVFNRKRKETLLADYRNGIGGQEFRAAVQLLTTEGDPYALELEIHPGIPGYELFAEADTTTRLVFEGEMRLVTRYDSRYAKGDDDAGRRVNEMRLDVRYIRTPHADEPDGATAVWMEGTVMEPPRFYRHHEQPALEVGITTLRVRVPQAQTSLPAYPRLRRISQEMLYLQVAVRTSDELAGLLYHPGNTVRIDGELSRWLLPQAGPVVLQTTDKLRTEHQEAQAQATSAEERAALSRTYRRAVERLTLQPRTLILASYVEAADETSTPISYNEARSERRAVSAQRRRTAARPQRPQRPSVSAAPVAQEATSPGVADPTSESPPLPRPRRRATPGALPVVEPMMGEPVMGEPVMHSAPEADIVHANGVLDEK